MFSLSKCFAGFVRSRAAGAVTGGAVTGGAPRWFPGRAGEEHLKRVEKRENEKKFKETDEINKKIDKEKTNLLKYYKMWIEDSTNQYHKVLTPEEKAGGFKFKGQKLTDLQIKWIREANLPWPEEEEKKPATEEEEKKPATEEEEKKPATEEEEKKREEEKKKAGLL